MLLSVDRTHPVYLPPALLALDASAASNKLANCMGRPVIYLLPSIQVWSQSAWDDFPDPSHFYSSFIHPQVKQEIKMNDVK